MGKRKVTILEPAVEEVARVALHIEGKGKDYRRPLNGLLMRPFAFFESLADDTFVHRPCKHPAWKKLDLRCANFRKKYIVSYLDSTDEITICEFALQKMLK